METEPTSNYDGDWNAACKYCGQPEHQHISKEHSFPDYKHRMPCGPEKAAMLQETRRMVQMGQMIVFVGWILVPLLIAIVGFASVWLGVLLFIISLFQIGWKAIQLYGDPERWIPGYKSKKDKERRMRHYFYHCERNPKGFERLRLENWQRTPGE